MKLKLVLFLFTISSYCLQAQKAFLITENSWTGIKTSTDILGLIKIFGPTNIKDERICGAECVDSVDVTKVYPGATKEIIVYWADSLYHKKISMLVADDPHSPYKTQKGIGVGTTLGQLLRLNGKKITFGGFGWDYGGGIMSFHNGALAGSKILFLLDISAGGPEGLMGERELNTDMALVKKYLSKIKVVEMTLSF
jgi:hypothetical protein